MLILDNAAGGSECSFVDVSMMSNSDDPDVLSDSVVPASLIPSPAPLAHRSHDIIPSAGITPINPNNFHSDGSIIDSNDGEDPSEDAGGSEQIFDPIPETMAPTICPNLPVPNSSPNSRSNPASISSLNRRRISGLKRHRHYISHNPTVKHTKIHRNQIEKDNIEVKALFSYLSHLYRYQAGNSSENFPGHHPSESISHKKGSSPIIRHPSELSTRISRPSSEHPIRLSRNPSEHLSLSKISRAESICQFYFSDYPRELNGKVSKKKSLQHIERCNREKNTKNNDDNPMSNGCSNIDNIIANETDYLNLTNKERYDVYNHSDPFSLSLLECGCLPLQSLIGSIPGVESDGHHLPVPSPFMAAVRYLESIGQGIGGFNFTKESEGGFNFPKESEDSEAMGIELKTTLVSGGSTVQSRMGVDTYEGNGGVKEEVVGTDVERNEGRMSIENKNTEMIGGDDSVEGVENGDEDIQTRLGGDEVSQSIGVWRPFDHTRTPQHEKVTVPFVLPALPSCKATDAAINYLFTLEHSLNKSILGECSSDLFDGRFIDGSDNHGSENGVTDCRESRTSHVTAKEGQNNAHEIGESEDNNYGNNRGNISAGDRADTAVTSLSPRLLISSAASNPSQQGTEGLAVDETQEANSNINYNDNDDNNDDNNDINHNNDSNDINNSNIEDTMNINVSDDNIISASLLSRIPVFCFANFGLSLQLNELTNEEKLKYYTALEIQKMEENEKNCHPLSGVENAVKYLELNISGVNGTFNGDSNNGNIGMVSRQIKISADNIDNNIDNISLDSHFSQSEEYSSHFPQSKECSSQSSSQLSMRTSKTIRNTKNAKNEKNAKNVPEKSQGCSSASALTHISRSIDLSDRISQYKEYPLWKHTHLDGTYGYCNSTDSENALFRSEPLSALESDIRAFGLRIREKIAVVCGEIGEKVAIGDINGIKTISCGVEDLQGMSVTGYSWMEDIDLGTGTERCDSGTRDCNGTDNITNNVTNNVTNNTNNNTIINPSHPANPLSHLDDLSLSDSSGAIALLALMTDCVFSSEFDSYFDQSLWTAKPRGGDRGSKGDKGDRGDRGDRGGREGREGRGDRRDRSLNDVNQDIDYDKNTEYSSKNTDSKNSYNKKRKFPASDDGSVDFPHSRRQQKCPKCGEFKKGHICSFN